MFLHGFQHQYTLPAGLHAIDLNCDDAPIVAAFYAFGIMLAHDHSAILAQDHTKRVHALVFGARSAMVDRRRLGDGFVPWIANPSTQ
jgi:hypothetical protein